MLIITYTILLSLSSISQPQYLFGYDAAGNRISRMGIILNKATQNVDTTGNTIQDNSMYGNESKQQYEANIEDYAITVYPNPTRERGVKNRYIKFI